MAGETVIELRGITRRFGAVTALDGLSLEVGRGEIFGLLGPNGAGKSTAIHCIVGLLQPDSGDVRVRGGNPEDPLVRTRLGIAPQMLSLYDVLTAEENLYFFGRLYHVPGPVLRKRVAWALQFVGLESRARHAVKTYSGGMQRRLNLAVALVHDPEILLLDEPTVGIDPQSRNSIFDNIAVLAAEGRTIIYTTHYMEEAERLCNRVGIIDHGRLLALDTVEGLISAQGGFPELVVNAGGKRLEFRTPDPLAELNRVAAGARIEQFSLQRPTLEQVFLNLTGRSLRD
jgi:ABC-2 type transport system ATP-binding protein